MSGTTVTVWGDVSSTIPSFPPANISAQTTLMTQWLASLPITKPALGLWWNDNGIAKESV